MKNISFYSQKKRDKFLWIPIILLFSLMYACGPSKEELDAMKQSEMRHVTIAIDNCGCSEYTATYYDVDGCEYVGYLNNGPHDFASHSGQCKRCEKRQVHLMDSLIKENLKAFFAIEKK
jgi:hypothetical protein